MAPPRDTNEGGVSRRNAPPSSASAARARPTRLKDFTEYQGGGSVYMGPLSSLPYWTPYAFVLVPYYGFSWTWSTVWFLFTVVPLLDFVLPKDYANPTEEQRRAHENSFAFKLPLLCWLPVSAFTVCHAMGRVASGDVSAPLDLLGLALSTALILGGVGINVSHELMHKRGLLERGTSYALLAVVHYMHFFIEHQAGHHKTVATPEDPASSRRGDRVYGFAVRSMVGGYASSWNHERRRVGLGPANRMLRFAAVSATLCVAAYRFYGAAALAFYLAASFLSFFLLEVVNFIEHWGLSRERLPDGSYERVNPSHSWNAANVVTNLFLFQLQRHSHHHADSSRAYWLLKCYEESPEMPTGYAGMVVAALCPPAFDRIMSSVLDAYDAADNKRHTDYSEGVRLTGYFLVAWSVGFTALSWACLGMV